jgi:tetratricopeptide (TPR) repeat protein
VRPKPRVEDADLRYDPRFVIRTPPRPWTRAAIVVALALPAAPWAQVGTGPGAAPVSLDTANRELHIGITACNYDPPDLEIGLESLDIAMRGFRAVDDRENLAEALIWQATCHRRAKALDAAQASVDEAAELTSDVPRSELHLRAMRIASLIAMDRARYEGTAGGPTGDPAALQERRRLAARYNEGVQLLNEARWGEAVAPFAEVSQGLGAGDDLGRKAANNLLTAVSWHADELQALGDAPGAARSLSQGVQHLQALEMNGAAVGQLQYRLGTLHWGAEDLRSAAFAYEGAVESLERAGMDETACSARTMLAKCLVRLRVATVFGVLDETEERCADDPNAQTAVAQVRRRLAAEVVKSDPEAAFAQIVAAARNFEARGQSQQIAETICPASIYGAQELVLSDSEEAAEALDQAEAYCAGRGSEMLELAELHNQLTWRLAPKDPQGARVQLLQAADLFDQHGDAARARQLRELADIKFPL